MIGVIGIFRYNANMKNQNMSHDNLITYIIDILSTDVGKHKIQFIGIYLRGWMRKIISKENVWALSFEHKSYNNNTISMYTRYTKRFRLRNNV